MPQNQYTGGGVTLRTLLSHTSGTGDGFGFPGYDPSAPRPTLAQILDGKPPSNVGPVFWERAPFTAYKYSGGGLMIVEMVLQHVYGKPFAEIMQEQVLTPVGMTHSTYEQPLPARLDGNAARAHYGDGKAMNAKWHVYPEQSAAGLWTTPSDLLRLGIELQKALRGESKLLSRSTALEMVAPVGTGPFAIGFGIASVFVEPTSRGYGKSRHAQNLAITGSNARRYLHPYTHVRVRRSSIAGNVCSCLHLPFTPGILRPTGERAVAEATAS